MPAPASGQTGRATEASLREMVWILNLSADKGWPTMILLSPVIGISEKS